MYGQYGKFYGIAAACFVICNLFCDFPLMTEFLYHDNQVQTYECTERLTGLY